jgi:small GTP-binding protein
MSKINYKIILIGNSGVGKTSIFRKLFTGEFTEKNISTIGVEKKTIDVDGIVKNKDGKEETKSFSISLFDTAGQEKFRAITLNYYKGADGILLIYDICSKDSFDTVEEWINSIKEAIDSSEESRYVIILIGNKLDLVEDGEKEREVQEEDAIKICEKNNLIWGGERSTKTIDKLELRKVFGEYMAEIFGRIGEKKVGAQVAKKISQQKKKKGRGCFGFLTSP